MRRRRLGLALAVTCLATSTAHAVVPRSLGAGRAPIDQQDLVALPAAQLAGPVRARVDVTWNRALRPAAWRAFTAARPGAWQASWDSATSVPTRVWGAGIAAPGASASPALAEQAARAVLGAHLDLLAPGASPADLELVSNHWDGAMRTVGFVQRHQGLRVVGGQLSVRIKNDRIFVLSSQALPHVAIAGAPTARTGWAGAGLVAAARAATVAELGLADSAAITASAGSPHDAGADLVILPLVGERGVLGYRVVQPVTVDAGADGRWTVYVDPATARPLARRSELHFTSATLLIDTVDRYPARPRQAVPAVEVDLVAGQPFRTTSQGQVNWATATPLTATAMATGRRVIIENLAGPLAVAPLTFTPGSQVVWSAGADELIDAQLQLLVHGERVREFARTFAGGLPFLDAPVLAHANINDECNAYSNGTRIHFFKSSDRCANTALLADVIYHEYGHSIHRHAIIEGVGAFDGAMSEGLSDFLAAAITEDSGMGRGFFKTDEPLREIDPPDFENSWPRDVGEIHYTGIIYAGTFWDLRERLIAELGPEQGRQHTLNLFFASVQRATDIPSSLVEVLAADDDDGDLSNGTPNECAIRSVFSAHGMRTTTGDVVAPGALDAPAGQTTAPVDIAIRGVSSVCPTDAISRVVVKWQPGVGGSPSSGQLDASPSAGGYHAEVPLPNPGGRVDFTVTIEFADGSKSSLPDNLADSRYQIYNGPTVALYCTDFEGDDPFATGWTRSHGGGDAQFEWGAASDERSATDPASAYSGQNLLGLGLGTDYWDDASAEVHLPPIDVGQYSYVLLQYRRWLAVEDAYYDQAIIRANGEPVWTNLDSMMGDDSSTHHIDKEWRFDSVALSSRFAGPTLDLSFELSSDQGLHFGGWNLDDVCVVADPTSICGDGARTGGEECDAGPDNANAADACRLNCKFARCGDGVVDSGEECDGGPSGDPTCLPACVAAIDVDDEPGTGCCQSGGGGAGGALALTGLVGLIGLGRARRRRR
ncbi:MAG: M36 family metallopeptidase [Kofleriaceae bacterium]|nr:M36 family metallopeptidase [Kofleriaceae bacterium]